MKDIIRVLLLLNLFLLLSPAYSADSPQSVYKNYTKALSTNQIEEIAKHVTSERKNEIMGYSPVKRWIMIKLIKEFQPKNIKTVRQDISEDNKTATLILTGLYSDGVI